MTIRAELDEALTSAPRLPRDGALVELGRHYADLLDDLFDRLAEASPAEEDEAQNFGRLTLAISRVGARYESVLDRMGMAPAARPGLRGVEGGGDDSASAHLDALRNGGGAPPPGIDLTAGVDPAVTEADA